MKLVVARRGEVLTSERARIPARWLGALWGVLLTLCLTVALTAAPAQAESNPSTDAGRVLPDPDALLDGYTLKPGLDSSLYAGLELVSAVYEGDVLKVTGTFNEPALFGGRSDWNIYLPPPAKFEGRFYQRVYPFNTGNLPDDLRFSSSSGGYQVEYYELFKINGAALAADISRTVAANVYGLDREGVRQPGHPDYVYGYAYGGSGGSPAAIDILEDDTYNVWDGAIPFVMIAPYTYPSGGDTIPVFRNLLLRGLSTDIWDAMRVGGMGREAMYQQLTPLQRRTVAELELLGLRWQDIGSVGTDLSATGGPSLPDGYVEDFWTEPGYTGTEDSLIGQYFRDIRGTTIDGTLMTDERLAKIAWHRHRNFDADLGLFMYDHLDDLAKAGPVESYDRWTGDIKRKGMLVQNMQDSGAIYVTAEWYRQRVESHGKSDDFRVYVQESAGHFDNPVDSGGDVPYLGILEQALRDLAAWVEDDVPPAESTGYEMRHNQLYLDQAAAERHGLQPVISLAADGDDRADVTPANTVDFEALIEPATAGDVITRVEWNPETTGGTWTDLGVARATDGSVRIQTTHTYAVEGTHFPRVRVTAYRGGAPLEGSVGRLMNQASARVVVHPVSLQALSDLTEMAEADGSLRAPLSRQLDSTLDAALRHDSAGRHRQASADIERYLRQLERPAMQQHVEEDSRERLSEAARALVVAYGG